MTTFIARLRSLARDESGQDLIEYALLFTLIAVALIGGLSGASGEILTTWNDIASGIAAAVP